MIVTAICFLGWLLARLLLSLRYRTTVVGLDAVFKKPGPYLILPNHPAYCDPPTLLAALWGKFRMRPMLLETNFQSPIMAPLAWMLRAIKVPETEKASLEARRRAEQSVQEVIAALKAGDHVVLWPTGTLSRNGKDYLGAARTAADVLTAMPEATVVLIRNRGLWGSMFSWAYGTKPSLTKQLVLGARIHLSNLIFFTPRRRNTLTLEAFTAEERVAPSRDVLNPWLEAWYNADGGESPSFVPYHFAFGPRTTEFPPQLRSVELDTTKIKPSTIETVAQFVGEVRKRPLDATENRAATTFAELGMDSLEGMEVAMRVEQQFGFSSDVVPVSLAQLWLLAEGQLESGPPKPPPPTWFRPPSDTRAMTILGETLSEAFVNRALACKKEVACADDLSGAVVYEKLLVGATTMADRFRALPGENVALLLPASVAADIAFFALHLANKLPVLLNWTTGPAAIDHAVKLMKISRVVTSKRFIDRTHIQIPGTEFVYLEDIRATMGKFELLSRLLAVRYRGGAIRRWYAIAITVNPDQPAAVLFTSGSEKAPKAVPLTHRNIIADQRGAVPPQQLTRADSVLGFLPMFHSFGLTIAGLFPILAGAKVVHHPDPTDASGLARKAAAYKPTIVIATPTFVNFILNRCQPGDLSSVRIFVVGAERCPPELFDRVKALAPQATVLEGYGVTECSPCVAVNPVDAVRRGTVGKPLPGVEVIVTDLETEQPVPVGSMGMLLVHGPIVFPGYLGHTGEQPFRTLNGKKWYVTGDLAALDKDGYIAFHGRLKRFIKAGGEMISLPALEEPLARVFPPTDDGPSVAVEGIERDNGGRLVVLFSREEITLKNANGILHLEGFRGVMRLDEVRQVERIPVLGTGKTDYKALRAMLVAD